MITLIPNQQSKTRKIFFLYLIFGIWNLLFPCVARATSLSVSMSVGLTYFEAQGYTGPFALVKLIEEGSVIATTSTDSTGYFTLSTLGFDGLHTYTLYATDPEGRNTESLILSVNLTPGTTTSLGSLILPPTYHHNGLDREIGQDLLISGYGVPGSQILLVLDSSEHERVTVGADGRYNLRLTTDFLSAGSHHLFLKNQLASGSASDPTITLSLWMKERSSTTTPQTTPTSTPIITPSSSPRLVSLLPTLSVFDLDGDGKISLDELRESLLLWLKSLSGQGDNCDLNHDGKCNLQDFSILLYYIDR